MQSPGVVESFMPVPLSSAQTATLLVASGYVRIKV
jgi:hypothetical protein